MTTNDLIHDIKVNLNKIDKMVDLMEQQIRDSTNQQETTAQWVNGT
jgi:hypothetical protein